MKQKKPAYPGPLKGVNLGGWLVLEKWMTPSVFASSKAVNEYELSQTDEGRVAIAAHRQQFITEADFAWLARTGIEIIRVPIGYWALEDAPPYVTAQRELAWCMRMAEKYHLKVLLCLHAAPGAQNANDHSGSGKPGPVGWYKRAHRQHTTKLLLQLAAQYGSSPVLWGVQLLNEPLVPTWYHRVVMWWWVRRTITRLRRVMPPQVRLVVSDAYQPSWWSGKIKGETLDIHHYQCFSDEDVAADQYQYHDEVLYRHGQQYRRYANDQPTIIGEWSATLPPRTMNEADSHTFCRAQLAMPARADAWFFWSYKTEHPGSWNFRDLYEKGYFKGILSYNKKNEENDI